MIWCWRCKSEVPMLDETEWAIIDSANDKAWQTREALIEERFEPLRSAYKESRVWTKVTTSQFCITEFLCMANPTTTAERF